MRWIDTVRRRFSSLPLGAKLAWLSAGLSALFVAATLIPLSITTRQAARQIIATELRQTQRALIENQSQELFRLEYTATLIGQTSTIRAAIAEDRSQVQQRAHRRGLDPVLVVTVRAALNEALPKVNKDLIVITDDSGRVFAAASRYRTSIVTGTDLSSLQAVHVALDPDVPADTGVYGVIDLSAGTYSVAAVPLVSGGRTLGAILLGQRIDSTYLASVRRTFGGDVVVAAGNEVIASTRRDLGPAEFHSLALSEASGATQPTVRFHGQQLVVAPLSLGENREGAPVTLWLLQPRSQLSAAVTRPLVLQFVLYGLLAVLLSGLGAVFVAQTVLHPLNRFINYMRGVTPTAEPTRRFKTGDASPEIHALDDSFTTLMQSLSAERGQLERRTVELAAANTDLREEVQERERAEHALRESEAQLRQSQKLEAIGTLAGGVAHDFNNLLTVITGYTQLALLRTPAGDSMREDLKQVVEASDRAARLTHQLLAFSRKQVFLQSVIDLSAVVEGIAPMLRRLIGETIELRFACDAQVARIIADRGQLEQVIINLVVNARDAMPGGGILIIRTANGSHQHERSVLLSVSDTGVGIPPDVRDRIFEPFYTTKEVGKGTGLGLSTVYGIVKQSGGTIELESEVGKGTTFSVLLPRGGDQSSAMEDGVAATAMPHGSETILLVEDEPEVRALARRTLEGLGYTVLTSVDSSDAVRLGTTMRCDVVLSDVVMPSMSGPQVVSRLAAAGTRPIIVYMSGYADDAIDKYELDPDSTFLRKPFSPAELAQTIRAAIDRTRATARS
jgi:signal transduction histidine kinase/CheY-like chemotaxis protein